MLSRRVGIKKEPSGGTGLGEEIGGEWGDPGEDLEACIGFEGQEGDDLLHERADDQRGPAKLVCEEIRNSSNLRGTDRGTWERFRGERQNPNVDTARPKKEMAWLP